MKLQPLLVALALALASGASFAMAPHASTMHHHASAHRHHVRHMAARHHHRAEHIAMRHRHYDTHAMGAGPAPTVNLQSAARERRMDRAYDDWLARRR